MTLPVNLEENDGSYDIVDSSDEIVGIVLCEDDGPYKTAENLKNTREDAFFIKNALNNFDSCHKYMLKYLNIIKKTEPENKDIAKIEKILSSFETIDYANGLPYSWDVTN